MHKKIEKSSAEAGSFAVSGDLTVDVVKVIPKLKQQGCPQKIGGTFQCQAKRPAKACDKSRQSDLICCDGCMQKKPCARKRSIPEERAHHPITGLLVVGFLTNPVEG